jgi:hypothetical protein
VHPAARRHLRDETLIDAPLEEENRSKRVLTQLESLSIDATEFDALFSRLEQSVLVHAQVEERDEFGRLGTVLNRRTRASNPRAPIYSQRPSPSCSIVRAMP